MDTSNPDIALVGAGIMSATLAVILKELQPDLNIQIFETSGRPSRRELKRLE
jgi:L-2-hydroxyglutarate oxidase LhgO